MIYFIKTFKYVLNIYICLLCLVSIIEFKHFVVIRGCFAKSRDIVIREDKDGKIFVTGARDEIVTSYSEAIRFLEYGTRSRTTAETSMNLTSSRSHAIFTVAFEVLKKTILNVRFLISSIGVLSDW